MPERNFLDSVALEVAGEIAGLGPKPGQRLAVPFGQEQLSARDYANRLFSMSPEQGKEAIQGMSAAELAEVVNTYQNNQKGKIDIGKKPTKTRIDLPRR